MAVAFTTTDNLDGTATVAVTGSGAGDTNEVYTAPIDNQWGDAISWTSRGDRTGDGDIDFSISAGAYMLGVVSDGAWLPPQPVHVAGGELAILEHLLQSMQSRVRLMTLPGVLEADRNAYLVIDEINVRNFPRRSVWISPVEAEAMVTAGVPVGLDGIEYPILVGLSEAANRSQANRAALLQCRENIRKGLLNQRLTVRMGGVNWCGVVTGVRPLETVSRLWWLNNVFVSAQVFRVQVNEERGLV